MYKLKSIAPRAALMGTAVALMATGLVPVFTYADALNPLTHRSLALSSSAPGWDHTDGSGNVTYAPPNSGANGQKTGNTFQFNVSTNSSASGTNPQNAALKAFTFQYCTKSAGDCIAPGNDTPTGTLGAYTDHGVDSVSGHQSDLVVKTSTPTEITTAYSSIFNSDASVKRVPARGDTEGNFAVLTSSNGTSWTQVTGWTMVASNVESGGSVAAGTETGKDNYITLYNATSTFKPTNADFVKVVFFGTDGNYITNPGEGAFFVKINDYSGLTGGVAADPATLVDGGVTVANVMNQSIEIQTKVLETMDFSVGTIDPDTLSDADLSTALAAPGTTHAPCDRILGTLNPATPLTNPVNTLQMGDSAAENSLETDKTYSTHSYWRLSSNSSAGATVYYSGVTLSNTVGDQIDPIGSVTPGDGIAVAPHVGSEQFGLALANGTLAANPQPLSSNPSSIFAVNYGVERGGVGVHTISNLEDGADNATSGVDTSTTTELASNASYHTPRLYPLIPETNYDSGAGTVNNNYDGSGSDPVNTKFAFDVNSNTIPTPIATESNQVVDCVTGKMRYIANIAATTPAGIYTTKVNYIAAPQY